MQLYALCSFRLEPDPDRSTVVLLSSADEEDSAYYRHRAAKTSNPSNVIDFHSVQKVIVACTSFVVGH